MFFFIICGPYICEVPVQPTVKIWPWIAKKASLQTVAAVLPHFSHPVISELLMGAVFCMGPCETGYESVSIDTIGTVLEPWAGHFQC